jgi:alcohol dehydrogenase class IV
MPALTISNPIEVVPRDPLAPLAIAAIPTTISTGSGCAPGSDYVMVSKQSLDLAKPLC